MRHWNPASTDADAVRLSATDRQRLAELLGTSKPPAERPTRQPRPEIGSLVGLVLSLAFLAGIAWAIAPVEPVSAEVR
jgi:hypothetical protein